MSKLKLTLLLTALGILMAPHPSSALDRKHFSLLPANGFETNIEYDPRLRSRQNQIFEALRKGDYEAFATAAAARGPEGVELETLVVISKRDFDRQYRELSKLTESNFRRMHGIPKLLNSKGRENFEHASGSAADSVIVRTYLAKLSGNRQSGRVHVMYDPETWAVTGLFVNRDAPSRSFTLPEPDLSHPLHPGKDFSGEEK